MAMGGLDSRGVYIYGEDDVADGTESGIHNLGQQSLSNVVDDIRPRTNTVWTSVPGRHSSISDFTADATFATLTYRRRNGEVQLRGTATATASIPASTTLFTLPLNFRPTHKMRFPGIVGSSFAIFEVRPTGIVICSIAIPVGSWSIDCVQFGAA